MSISTKLSLLLFYKKVGEDQFGNKYYISKSKNNDNRHKRAIWYKGLNEPSKVPPLWHAWLHYTSDELPKHNDKYHWQSDYLPNLTGTNEAYLPKGHLHAGGKRSKATGDYSSWQPE
ncbi:MAG: NADH:ubiquinone oxidoreductase subunit NDUFA12 [Sphingobacteriia bacterium]|nr:NADH:ubiquinone oxidoreductase subunit NDUFA12 [Sphingobacteriia bacterium]